MKTLAVTHRATTVVVPARFAAEPISSALILRLRLPTKTGRINTFFVNGVKPQGVLPLVDAAVGTFKINTARVNQFRTHPGKIADYPFDFDLFPSATTEGDTDCRRQGSAAISPLTFHGLVQLTSPCPPLAENISLHPVFQHSA